MSDESSGNILLRVKKQVRRRQCFLSKDELVDRRHGVIVDANPLMRGLPITTASDIADVVPRFDGLASVSADRD
jgi:hypothetical protein